MKAHVLNSGSAKNVNMSLVDQHASLVNMLNHR